MNPRRARRILRVVAQQLARQACARTHLVEQAAADVLQRTGINTKASREIRASLPHVFIQTLVAHADQSEVNDRRPVPGIDRYFVEEWSLLPYSDPLERLVGHPGTGIRRRVGIVSPGNPFGS